MDSISKPKQDSRKASILSLGENVKVVLELTTEKMLDIKLGLEYGIFTTNTMFIVFEKNKKIIEKIKKAAKELGLINFHVIYSKIEYFEISKLKKILGRKKIDAINFDSCGSLNYDVANWLNRLVKNKLIKKGSHIAFNFNMNGRGNNTLISHYIKNSINNEDVFDVGYGFKKESLDVLKVSTSWKNGIPNKNNKNFNLRFLAHLDIILDIFYDFYKVKVKNTLFYRANDSKTNMGTYIIEVN